MNRNAGNLPKATTEEERQRNIRAGSQMSQINNPCLSVSTDVQISAFSRIPDIDDL